MTPTPMYDRLTLTMRGIAFYHVLFALAVLLPITTAHSQPRKVTWEDLNELKNGKVPKNSQKKMGASMFGTGSRHYFAIYTPRAQAAMWAETAKENYYKLDSASYNPEMFNVGLKVCIYNLIISTGMAEHKDVRQIERVVLLKGEGFYEPDSIRFVEETLQNSYGAESVNVDAVAYFALEHFDGTTDLKFAVVLSNGKFEKKFKKKDILKLE